MKHMKKKTAMTGGFLCLIFLMSISPVLGQGGTTFATYSGHKFVEDYWAIEFDVIGGELVQDYTPGEFAEEYDDSNVDRNENLDANYYIAYAQTGQVQTLFMALTNYSWSPSNSTFYGTAPFQVLQQHYRDRSGQHIIIQNAFAGLLAYQDVGEQDGVPNANESVYYGYSLNSQYHKYLLNLHLLYNIGYRPINENRLPTVTPMIIDQEETDDSISYTFGISYEDLFITWFDMKSDQGLNTTRSARDLLGKVKAFCFLDSLNFTYKITGDKYLDRAVNITTTTEYDIGPITDLWIVDENEAKTEDFGGFYYPLHFNTQHTISKYNTSDAIESRLSGDEEVPGFSLAVANYARAYAISASIEETDDFTYEDESGEEIEGDSAEQNVTQIAINTGSDIPAFEIDFASKPNYTLDGGDPMPAPVRLYPNMQIKDKSIRDVDAMTMRFMTSFNRNMVQARVDRLNQTLDLEGKTIEIDVNRRDIFYTVCFPEWGGKTINQDPKFVAYAEPEDIGSQPDDDTTIGQRIPGYGVGILALAGIGGSFFIIRRSRRTIR